jgi:prepilin-type processing-associated H-X9-DG protein
VKPNFPNQRNRASTLIEVLLVILVLAFLAAMFLPVYQASHRRTNRLGCENNLSQIVSGYQLWNNDHNGKFPMEISTANGGIRESAVAGNAAATFQVISNELKTPKVLICPADKSRVAAINFSGSFAGANISYFVGVDAATNYPLAFLSGDDDFASNGVPVKAGLWEFSTNGFLDPMNWRNAPIGYGDSRHQGDGNIAFVDGRIEPIIDVYFVGHLSETGLATNRLAIP